MSLDRRQLLGAVAGAGSALVAGCSDVTNCLSPGGMPHDAEIAVTAVDTVPEDAPVVSLSSLAGRERGLLRTAIEEGVVRACMRADTDRTAAFRDVADAVGIETYLADGTDRYGLYVRITDQVFAATGDSPDDDTSPCC